MGRAAKIWLITAVFLIVTGCILWVCVMTANQWDFTKLSTVSLETNIHEINEKFRNITIESDTADIRLLPSEDGKCSVECHEYENALHSVSVKEDTLVIRITDSRKWFEQIGIHFGSPKITVYLPAQNYDTIASTVSTGGISVENISAGDLELTVSTGRISVSYVSCSGDALLTVTTGKTELSNLTCQNLISTGSTGSITLCNVIAAEKISIRRTTGNVRFESSDAAEISVKTSTGDITGTLLSDKLFIPETSTGKIHVPKGASGGKCIVSTSTGDIKLEIE